VINGRVIAHAVSRMLPTAEAWVRSKVRSICLWTKGKFGRFSPSTSVSPPNSHSTKMLHALLQSRDRAIGQLMAIVPSGLNLT
jgi:hypothetical protein